MALTKADIQARIAADLARKNLEEIEWADVTSAFAASTAAQRQRLLSALQSRNSRRVGEIVLQVVRVQLTSDANTEAGTMLADDQLSLTEIDRWLGIPTASL